MIYVKMFTAATQHVIKNKNRMFRSFKKTFVKQKVGQTIQLRIINSRQLPFITGNELQRKHTAI